MKPLQKNEDQTIVDCEYYFIQMIFCIGRNLLRKENRDLYDAMLSRYEEIYNKGRKNKIDIGIINNNFLNLFKL